MIAPAGFSPKPQTTDRKLLVPGLAMGRLRICSVRETRCIGRRSESTGTKTDVAPTIMASDTCTQPDPPWCDKAKETFQFPKDLCRKPARATSAVARQRSRNPSQLRDG